MGELPTPAAPALTRVRGRFAPSPTGELHLGNARTALLAWHQMRALGGAFVMRVEDLDRPREVPGAMARQLAALRALGIDWDEGPDRGGEFAPYTQSERLARYSDAIEKLRGQGRVYPCFCTRSEIAREASAPHGPDDEGPRYPGTCRGLSEADRRARENAGRKPSLRFRVEPGVMTIRDQIAGELRQDVEASVGDFVIQRADGVFAYQLAVVVDDAAMQISHVLRGEDLLASTPRQVQLFRALGAPVPEFAHVGLLLGPSGERLSKRDGAISVTEMIERGADPKWIRHQLEVLSGIDARSGALTFDARLRGPVRLPPALLAT